MNSLNVSQRLHVVRCVRKAVEKRLEQWDAARDLEQIFKDEGSGSIPELDVEDLIVSLATGLGLASEAMAIPASDILPEIERLLTVARSGT